MAYEGDRFFLYTGDFATVVQDNGLEAYDDLSDKFMGCTVDELDIIKTYFKSDER